MRQTYILKILIFRDARLRLSFHASERKREEAGDLSEDM